MNNQATIKNPVVLKNKKKVKTKERNRRKIKILFCGDSLSGHSGFTYVITNIMSRFASIIDPETGDRKYEIAYTTTVGGDSTGEMFQIHGENVFNTCKNIPVYNTQIEKQNSMKLFNSAVKTFKPDIVFCNLDPWHLDQLAFSQFRASYYWVQYSTFETPFYPEFAMVPTPVIQSPRKSIKEILSKPDILIPVTDMGCKVLDNIKIKHTKPVYNGLDVKSAEKGKLKKSEILGGIIKEGDFVFMTMGVNTERKKIDVVLEAFAKFLDKMDNNRHKYKLYIHSNLDKISGGSDLMTMVYHLGITENVCAALPLNKNQIMMKDELYRRYSVCDCYIGLPSGEGFGYGFAEALIHKKPVIYIDYGGHVDYLRGIGLPVKVKETFAARNCYMKWALADIDDAVKQMCRVVSDKKFRDTSAEKGYQKAIKELDWDIVFSKMLKIIETGYNSFEKPEIHNFNLQKII